MDFGFDSEDASHQYGTPWTSTATSTHPMGNIQRLDSDVGHNIGRQYNQISEEGAASSLGAAIGLLSNPSGPRSISAIKHAPAAASGASPAAVSSGAAFLSTGGFAASVPSVLDYARSATLQRPSMSLGVSAGYAAAGRLRSHSIDDLDDEHESASGQHPQGVLTGHGAGHSGVGGRGSHPLSQAQLPLPAPHAAMGASSFSIGDAFLSADSGDLFAGLHGSSHGDLHDRHRDSDHHQRLPLGPFSGHNTVAAPASAAHGQGDDRDDAMGVGVGTGTGRAMPMQAAPGGSAGSYLPVPVPVDIEDDPWEEDAILAGLGGHASASWAVRAMQAGPLPLGGTDPFMISLDTGPGMGMGIGMGVGMGLHRHPLAPGSVDDDGDHEEEGDEEDDGAGHAAGEEGEGHGLPAAMPHHGSGSGGRGAPGFHVTGLLGAGRGPMAPSGSGATALSAVGASVLAESTASASASASGALSSSSSSSGDSPTFSSGSSAYLPLQHPSSAYRSHSWGDSERDRERDLGLRIAGPGRGKGKGKGKGKALPHGLTISRPEAHARGDNASASASASGDPHDEDGDDEDHHDEGDEDEDEFDEDGLGSPLGGGDGTGSPYAYASGSSAHSSGTSPRPRAMGGKAVGPGKAADKRKEMRLERNREAARQSRRRKKAYLDHLTARIKELHAQLAAHRAAHCAAVDAVLNEQRAALLAALEPLAYRALLAPGSLSNEEEVALTDGAWQLVDRYGPNCVERRTVRDFHFDQLQRLLLPPHTKFLLWMLDQPFTPPQTATAASGSGGSGGAASSSSSSSSADPALAAAARHTRELWAMLCAEIGLAGDQADRLRTQLYALLAAPDTARETARLVAAHQHLARLRTAVTARAAAAHAQLEGIRGVLSPAQLVRYLAWVERNRERIAAGTCTAIVQTQAQAQASAGGSGSGTPTGASAGSGTGTGSGSRMRPSSSSSSLASLGRRSVGGGTGGGAGLSLTAMPVPVPAGGSGAVLSSSLPLPAALAGPSPVPTLAAT